jgi:GNAT superfamily N-acetyltransferase
MEIFQYTPDMQAPVTQFYNRLTANVPHCYPVTEEEFATAVRGVTTGKADKNEGGLDSETAFVAITEGAVQAFIHVGLGQIRDEDIGIIRFLGYDRGARHAGQAVLERVEAYLKAFNVTRIFAFRSNCRYHFYHFEYAYLSDALDQVQALLGFNGYHRYNGWVFLDWENYSVTPIPPNLSVTFSVDWLQERGQRPNSIIKAHRDGEQVGLCESVSGGEYSSHPDAQNWLHTVYLEIEGEFQGQGLGRYLLQYALQEMKKIGYRHAAISTGWDDYRALLFYSNCGYRVVDWTYGYEKVLSEPPGHN